MAGEDIYTIWQIFGPGGLIDKLGPDRAIRELKKRCDAGAIIGCSLYKLLIEKWIDVATGAKDPGQRGPAEDFMSSAGEDELVKKIEDLHVQYPNGIPRAIRMDVKDEWNAALEQKVGRRIPLDPKDASKKDIAESKKIAEQLAAGVGLPRPAKPKVGAEELPLPPPVKPVEREPPRAAPEVVPTPITTRAPPELDLMKKEIKERIEEEKRRRLKRGPIAGEQKEHYSLDKDIDAGDVGVYSRWTYDDFKIIINRTTDIETLMDLAKHIEESTVMTPGDKVSARQLAEKRKRDIVYRTPEIRKQAEEQEAEGQLAKIERQSPTPGRVHEREAGMKRSMYSGWTYDAFKTIINRTTDIDDLLEQAKHIDESDVMTSGDKVSVRQLVEKRKRLIESGAPEIRKQIEEQQRERLMATPGRVREREDDKKKDDDVMQEPRDYTQWQFADFEGLIPGLEDPEDLEELNEYIDASDKLSESEAETLRNLIRDRIKEVEKTGS
jgi:hypothetical protein